MSRVYVTQNNKYPVVRSTSDGREVINNRGHDYAIIGFADSEKLGSILMGTDRYWHVRNTKDQLTRGNGTDGSFEKQLERIPKQGLQIIAWLIKEDDTFTGPASGAPDEMLSSIIKEIRDN
jgi:hypothetical protein